MLTKENFTVTCKDGVHLKGLLLIPEKPKAVLQFNGGTATKKEFYLSFLTYLANHNYICCLWDYRGSGESAPENLKGCDYKLQDYGIQDMPAIKNYLTRRFSNLPLLLMGHSVGGQLVGFMDNLTGYQGMIAMTVSTGHIGHMTFKNRCLSNFLFYMFTPFSLAVNGYLNSKKYGFMEDLPKNVILEWRDWCTKADYFFDEKFLGKTVPAGQFQHIPFPIHLFWTTDDFIANERSVPSFWKHIKSQQGIKITKITPESIGVKSIGHFGFFRKKMADKFWPKILKQLDSYLPQTASANN